MFVIGWVIIVVRNRGKDHKHSLLCNEQSSTNTEKYEYAKILCTEVILSIQCHVYP